MYSFLAPQLRIFLRKSRIDPLQKFRYWNTEMKSYVFRIHEQNALHKYLRKNY